MQLLSELRADFRAAGVPSDEAARVRTMEQHSPVKPVSRGKGRSATAAAAYRAAELLTDERTGDIHDYRRKQGVTDRSIFLPDGAAAWMADRNRLWNAVELREKHPRAVTARELEVALPCEMNRAQRLEAGEAIARRLIGRYGVAVDVCWHNPHRDGDQRNFHVHMLFTTRRIDGEKFGEKTRELDDIMPGKDGAPSRGSREITAIRAMVAAELNLISDRDGLAVRVEHESFEKRGIDQEPTVHVGPSATEIDRRGQRSDLGRINRRIRITNDSHAHLRRQVEAINRSIEQERRRPWQGQEKRQGRPPPRPDRDFNRSARAGAREAAERLKAKTATAAAALRAARQAAYSQRRAERGRFESDRRDGRAAIYQKYASALDALWSPRSTTPEGLVALTRTLASDRPGLVREALRYGERQRAFEKREETVIGRVTNAVRLGAGDGIGRFLKLALSEGARRRAFDGYQMEMQRALNRSVAQPRRTLFQFTPKPPEPKRLQAERIKAIRTAELAAYDAATSVARADLKTRHDSAILKEGEEKQAFAQRTAAAWQQHRIAYGWVARPSRPFAEAAAPSRVKAQAEPEAKTRKQAAEGSRTAGQGTGLGPALDLSAVRKAATRAMDELRQGQGGSGDRPAEPARGPETPVDGRSWWTPDKAAAYARSKAVDEKDLAPDRERTRDLSRPR